MPLIKLDWNMKKEYKILINDIVKFLSIILIAFYIQQNSSNEEFFNEKIFDIIVYLLVGYLGYNLVIKKLYILL